MQGVSGSNPLSSTISFLFCKVQNTELKVSYKLFIGRKKNAKYTKFCFANFAFLRSKNVPSRITFETIDHL